MSYICNSLVESERYLVFDNQENKSIKFKPEFPLPMVGSITRASTGGNREYQNNTDPLECLLDKVDPQFETTQGFNYRLSVLLCQDGFSFLVTHAASRKVLKLSSYKLDHTALKPDSTTNWPQTGNEYFEELKKIDSTLMSWQSVDIAIASHKITLAPHSFMQDGNDLNIISAAYTVNPAEQLLSDPLSHQGPTTAMLVPRYVPEFCAAIFPGSVLHNSAAVFVKGVMLMHSQLTTRHVFINIYQGFFEIALIQGLRLLFLNAFRYSSPSDVLYYVIFVLEQLGFVASEEKVTLMGDVDANSTIFLQLKMYCGSIDFIAKPTEIEYGETFAEVAMHNYFTLLNIPICE